MSDLETVREFLGFIDYREHQEGNPWESLRCIEAEVERLKWVKDANVQAKEELLEEVERLRAAIGDALDSNAWRYILRQALEGKSDE